MKGPVATRFIDSGKRLVVLLFVADDVGIILLLAAEPVAQEGNPQSFAIGDVSVLHVERWVRESRAGDLNSDVEKQIDQRDTGKSDLQIAWRMLYAIVRNKRGGGGTGIGDQEVSRGAGMGR